MEFRLNGSVDQQCYLSPSACLARALQDGDSMVRPHNTPIQYMVTVNSPGIFTNSDYQHSPQNLLVSLCSFPPVCYCPFSFSPLMSKAIKKNFWEGHWKCDYISCRWNHFCITWNQQWPQACTSS